MSRITAYEATDGTLFKDKEAFKKHQAALNLANGILKIANKFGGNTALNAEVAEFILANGDDIKKALEGKAIEDAPQPEPTPAETLAPTDGVDALVAELGVAA